MPYMIVAALIKTDSLRSFIHTDSHEIGPIQRNRISMAISLEERENESPTSKAKSKSNRGSAVHGSKWHLSNRSGTRL